LVKYITPRGNIGQKDHNNFQSYKEISIGDSYPRAQSHHKQFRKLSFLQTKNCQGHIAKNTCSGENEVKAQVWPNWDEISF